MRVITKVFVSIVCVMLVIMASIAVAGTPSWWISRGVIDPDIATNDYAAANSGQLKWFAEKAYEELVENLRGDVGTNLAAVIASLSEADDYFVVNAGQLKNLVKPFYDRLIVEGYCTNYPWTTTIADDVSYAAVNIGQVKNMFSFDVTMDGDSDGMPDWWETHYFGSTTNQNGSGDYDSDGTSNLHEFFQGRDPTVGFMSDAGTNVVNLTVYTVME